MREGGAILGILLIMCHVRAERQQTTNAKALVVHRDLLGEVRSSERGGGTDTGLRARPVGAQRSAKCECAHQWL